MSDGIVNHWDSCKTNGARGRKDDGSARDGVNLVLSKRDVRKHRPEPRVHGGEDSSKLLGNLCALSIWPRAGAVSCALVPRCTTKPNGRPGCTARPPRAPSGARRRPLALRARWAVGRPPGPAAGFLRAAADRRLKSRLVGSFSRDPSVAWSTPLTKPQVDKWHQTGST